MEIRIEGKRLVFGDGLELCFQRTLRIPDDGKRYPLPPGLDSFPLRRVDDYVDRVPSDWRHHGGVFLPMYQREAMWLRFSGGWNKPRAVKVAVGKVCAITGDPWSDTLRAQPQDYLVTPPQPWLDGVFVRSGIVRQFVAMPLGLGYTVEGQVTGKEVHGGLQVRVFEPRPGRFPETPRRRGFDEFSLVPRTLSMSFCASSPPEAGAMGLAAGGQMKQKIYPDPHGIETWDPSNSGRIFVHIANSELWREITGEEPPATPVTAKSYAKAGLPWFELYDDERKSLAAQSPLANIKGTAEIDQEKSTRPLADDESAEVRRVRKLWTLFERGLVRDGLW